MYRSLNDDYITVKQSIEQIQNAIKTTPLRFTSIGDRDTEIWCNSLFDQSIVNFDNSRLPELSSFINDIDTMIENSIEQRKNYEKQDKLFAEYLQNLTNPINLAFRKDEICVELLSRIYEAVNYIINLRMKPKELYDRYLTTYNKADEYYKKLRNSHVSEDKKLQFLQLHLEKMTELVSINIELCDIYFNVYKLITRISLLKSILKELLGDNVFKDNYEPLINKKLNDDLFIISLFIMNNLFELFLINIIRREYNMFYINPKYYQDTIYKRTLDENDTNKAAAEATAAAGEAATAAREAATAAATEKNKVELIIQLGESSINATIKAAACPAAIIASSTVQKKKDLSRKNPFNLPIIRTAEDAVKDAVKVAQALDAATAAREAAEAAFNTSIVNNKLVILEKTTAKEAVAAAKEAMRATSALTSYLDTAATAATEEEAQAALGTLSIVAAQLAEKVASTNGLFINNLETAYNEQLSLVQLINNICNQINTFLLKDDILTTGMIVNFGGVDVDKSNIFIRYKLLLECVITRLSITMINNFIKLDINNNSDYNDIDSICNKSILTYIDGHYKKAKETYDTYQGSYDYSINSSIRKINQREMLDKPRIFPNKTKSLEQLEEMEKTAGIVTKAVMTATGIRRKTPEEIEEILEPELVKLVMLLLNQYFLTNYYTTIQDIEQFVQRKLESRLQPYIIKRAIMKLYYKQDPKNLKKPILNKKLYLIIESFILQTSSLFTDKLYFLKTEKEKIKSEKSRAIKPYFIYSGSLEDLAKKLDIPDIYGGIMGPAVVDKDELIRQLKNPYSELYTKNKDLIKEIKRLVKKLIIQKISDRLIAEINNETGSINRNYLKFSTDYKNYDVNTAVPNIFLDFQTEITTYLSNFKKIGFQNSLISRIPPIDIPNKQQLCSEIQSIYRLLGTSFNAPTQLPLLVNGGV